MNQKIKGRTYLITGASKGISYATSERLAKEGHEIIGLSRTLPPKGLRGEFVTLHLSDCKEASIVLERIAEKHGIYGSLNNVGLVRPVSLEGISLADFDAVIDLNPRVAIQVVEAVLPYMKAQNWGCIVQTSSLVAVGVPFRTSYSDAKTGLISFSRSWALELAQFAITVNEAAPGPVQAELFDANIRPSSDSRQPYIDNILLNRTGTPEEQATINAFLLGNESGFLTVQTIYMDGAIRLSGMRLSRGSISRSRQN